MNPIKAVILQKTRAVRQHAGFTLLEVLIALFVVTVGLLGIAGMNALAMNNSGAARTRDLAAIMANSLASAMTANQAYWAAGLLAAPASITVNGGTIAGDSTLAAAATDCSQNTCTPVLLAGYDLQQWGRTIQQLPGGNGAVTCTTTVGIPVTCTITVYWSENTVGTKLIAGTQGNNNLSYQTVVQP